MVSPKHPMLTMDKLISLCKRRGFIFPSSEIYGGISGSFDYGHLGVELKKNIKELWWNVMTKEEDNIIGLDSAIMMNAKTWEASGHTENFTDPMIDDKVSKIRYRADHLIEGYIAHLERKGKFDDAIRVKDEYQEALNDESMNKALTALIQKEKIPSPDSGVCDWTEVRQFNLMFETKLGAVADNTATVYLRPETAQGIFVNFHSAREAARMKMPFGIAQIGKAFRNEIVKGNFIFRMIEFEQMEMQYFIPPGSQKDYFKMWQEKRWNWYRNTLKINEDKLVWYKHDKLAHYADDAFDIKFRFPFGFEEIEGIHSRTDFDLRRHEQYSGKNMHYNHVETQEQFIPFVIETSAGCDRVTLAVLCDAYREDVIDGEARVVLQFAPAIAPVKIAILPLQKKDGLPELAKSIRKDLQKKYLTQYDETASIGRRYRRQDEIGTPYCITVDYDSLTDHSVTVRERDTTKQERVSISQLATYFSERF